ncbi:hypothetical protein BBP40_008734 [Aspergillus hancockii]|nr:hypothetical protein BBP40_008734 [Aspergillus hancockii]
MFSTRFQAHSKLHNLENHPSHQRWSSIPSYTLKQHAIPTWTPPAIDGRPLAIIGAGILGRRIACVFAAAGYNVQLRDTSEEARTSALDYIDKNMTEYRKLSGKTCPVGRYQAFADLNSTVAEAWLVIEAVPENLQLKIDAMAELDKFAPPDCIIASNSSSFRSDMMLEKVSASRRRLMCNIHFFFPPEVRPVELMTDGETDPEVFPFLTGVLEDCGVLPVTARKESTGFVFNRLWAAIKREILMILAEGVSEPKEIDKLWVEMFTNAPGPCAMMDKVGLDTVASIEDNYVEERGLDPALTTRWLRHNYIEQGKLGNKTSKGGLVPAQTKDREKTTTVYFLEMAQSSDLSNVTFMGENGRILRSTGDGKNVTPIVTGLKAPDGLGISQSKGKMFWTNMGLKPSYQDGSVMSANLDGSDIRTIIPEGSVHTPKQLVVDDQDGKVYFCDREGMAVHRCDFDGQGHEIIVSCGDCKTADKEDLTRFCVGIALDTNNGKLYWTQRGPSKGNQGRIFRANIEIPAGENASNRSDIEILLEGLPEPIDLDIVPETQMLYWTDRGEHPLGNTLNRADVGKKCPAVQILARHFHDAIGLKVDSVYQHIYVTDLGGSVYRFDMNGSDKKVIHRDDGYYTGIALDWSSCDRAWLAK